MWRSASALKLVHVVKDIVGTDLSVQTEFRGHSFPPGTQSALSSVPVDQHNHELHMATTTRVGHS